MSTYQVPTSVCQLAAVLQTCEVPLFVCSVRTDPFNNTGSSSSAVYCESGYNGGLGGKQINNNDNSASSWTGVSVSEFALKFPSILEEWNINQWSDLLNTQALRKGFTSI